MEKVVIIIKEILIEAKVNLLLFSENVGFFLFSNKFFLKLFLQYYYLVYLFCTKSVEAEINHLELNKILCSALKKVTPEERSLVLLRFIEEKSYKEITKLIKTRSVTLRKKYEKKEEIMSKFSIYK